jgi:uncharacterized protein YodC (DUF2158 family)
VTVICEGLVVRLKSGGPLMTVGTCTNERDRTVFRCYWFDSDGLPQVLHEGDFHKDALNPIDPTSLAAPQTNPPTPTA